jgi:glucokinase
MTILAGDAGGTKTRLALYERTGSAGLFALERQVLADFESRSAPSI